MFILYRALFTKFLLTFGPLNKNPSLNSYQNSSYLRPSETNTYKKVALAIHHTEHPFCGKIHRNFHCLCIHGNDNNLLETLKCT